MGRSVLGVRSDISGAFTSFGLTSDVNKLSTNITKVH